MKIKIDRNKDLKLIKIKLQIFSSENKPPCYPNCNPDCQPKCYPNCNPNCEPNCNPKCVPVCSPSCSPCYPFKHCNPDIFY